MGIRINEDMIKNYEDYVKNFFSDPSIMKDRESDVVDMILSYDSKAMESVLALDSYILQNYRTASPEEKAIMDSYLKIFYKTFIKNPDRLIDSELLQTKGVVENLCPDLKLSQGNKTANLKDLVKSRYLSRAKGLDELFKKDKETNSLSDAEINAMMHMLKKTIGSKKPEDIKMQQEYVKKLLDQNKKVGDLLPSQLEFLGKYIIERTQDDRLKEVGHPEWKEDIHIYVGTAEPNHGGHSNKKNIFLNKDCVRRQTLDEFVAVAAHETEHWVQRTLAQKDDKTKAGLDYAIISVVRNYYRENHEDFEIYKKNYRFEDIEHDAEKVGAEKAWEYLYELGFEDRADKLVKGVKEKFKVRKFDYSLGIDENRNVRPRESLYFDIVNKAIADDPQKLEEAKALKVLYNPDGKPKSFKEIVSKDFKVNAEDTNGIYEQYCMEYISRGELDKLDLQSFPEEVQGKIASRLISILSTESYKIGKMDYHERDTAKVKLSKDTFAVSEKYHLDNSKRIMEFINKNYNHLKQLQKDGKFSSIIDMNSYDTYVIAFDYGRIYENLALENDPIIDSVKQAALEAKKRKFEHEKTSSAKDRGSLNTKKRFIGDLLDAYDTTEKEYQFETRNEFEEDDIMRVKEYVESGGLKRILISDLEGKWRGRPSEEGFKVEYSQKQVSALVRLMKASQLLTVDKNLNPEGIDYIKQFTDAPEINAMLLKLCNEAKKEPNSYIAELFENAKNEKGKDTTRQLTDGELARKISLDSIKKTIYGVRMPEIDEQAKKLVQVKQMSQEITDPNIENPEGR